MGALRRTASGSVGIDKAHTLDELERRVAESAGEDGAVAAAFRALFLDPVGDLGIEESEIPKGLRDVLQKARVIR
ncbi:MAG TPA: hypothetical protein DEB24_02755 [Coriobacteriia bacterium]|nr:hypothetical protein [Coriobacteriia bacterium]